MHGCVNQMEVDFFQFFYEQQFVMNKTIHDQQKRAQTQLKYINKTHSNKTIYDQQKRAQTQK
jgi:hypothetical protein